MYMEDVPAARTLMQVVDVLGDQREVGRAGFELGQREVAWIGLRGRDQAAAPVVPLPNQLWITREGAGRGQIFGAEVFPKAACAAKGRDSAFRRDARSG